MSKRSHKPNKNSQDKIARAQHRNNFFRKIENICYLVAGKDAYKLIPQADLDEIYNSRLQSFKIVAAKDEPVNDSIVKEAISLIPPISKHTKIPISPNGQEISLDDYLTVGLSFILYLQELKETKFSKATELKTKLKDCYTYEESLKSANFQMISTIQTFGNMNSDLSKEIYWLNHSVVAAGIGKLSIQNLIEIHIVFPEHIQVTIDGNTRPATRAGWCFPNFGIENNILKPDELGIDGSFASIPLNVYIQSHALLRLTERLDNLLVGFLHYNLFLSLKFPKATKDKYGNILIEYRFFDTKTGYLRADIINGIILIRTFLFLTQNSTPEGDKLEEICGLGKLDKKYLALDKLSTFMSSDIENNEELTTIFKKAGCEGLLKSRSKFSAMTIKESELKSSNILLKYLGLDKSTSE